MYVCVSIEYDDCSHMFIVKGQVSNVCLSVSVCRVSLGGLLPPLPLKLSDISH